MTIVLVLIAGAFFFTRMYYYHSNERLPEVSPVPTQEATPVPTITPHPVFDHPTDGGLGPEIFEESEFPGRVETVEYQTSDYALQSGGSCIKSMRVYVPYGYDENQKYNVLILLHGSLGSESYWFDDERWYNDPDYENSYECHLSTVLDNMIANGLCDPCIVVSPTFYYSNSWRMAGDDTARDSLQFKTELRNDILPKLAQVYSVYDVGDRTHYGFIGASHGSEIGYNGILTDNLDLFSWYGLVSGCDTGPYTIEDRWSRDGFDDLTIDYLYSSCGENDYSATSAYSGYLGLLNECSKVTEENSEHVVIRESGHEDTVWIDAVYNCLLIFFQ